MHRLSYHYIYVTTTLYSSTFGVYEIVTSRLSFWATKPILLASESTSVPIVIISASIPLPFLPVFNIQHCLHIRALYFECEWY